MPQSVGQPTDKSTPATITGHPMIITPQSARLGTLRELMNVRPNSAAFEAAMNELDRRSNRFSIWFACAAAVLVVGLASILVLLLMYGRPA